MNGRHEGEAESGPADSVRRLLESSDFGTSLLADLGCERTVPWPLPVLGERLGGSDGQRFEILADLGMGGMGAVFRARDDELRRDVALKFLRPHKGASVSLLLPLLRQEAIAVARLAHGNIVRLFDLAEWRSVGGEPLPFLVMEFLAGKPLSRLLSRPLALERALELFLPICAGLAHAHSQHVIHRDLKPSNVFVLDEDGTVKLLDFGVAHILALAASSKQDLPRAGTPGYMAPEQWRGEPQDERTDLWAAGLLFYEMLAGRSPLPRESAAELRRSVLSPDPLPSIRVHRPELPEQVERVLAKALAKAPAKRFQSVAELAARLRELAEGLAPRAQPRARPERRQLALVACTLDGGAGLDPEELGELQAAYHRLCSGIVLRRGGVPAMLVGEQVLACFGYPRAAEDDAERAVLAGLEMVQAVRDELSPRGANAVRIGVHAEPVLLGDTGRGSAPSLQGRAPRLAAWLAEQAQPGTVVVSPAARDLLRGTFEVRPVDPRPFRWLGRTEPVAFGCVTGRRHSASRFAQARAAGSLTPLLGRERELAWLTALWERARGGDGGVVLIRGEPGIGKSRLLLELGRGVAPENQGRSQCWPQSGASLFQPVVELIRHDLALTPEELAGRKLEWVRERLGARGLSEEHVRELAELLSLAPMAPTPGPPPHVGDAQRSTLEAFTALLAREAKRRPLLLVLEDVQWADPSTLHLIAFVLDRLAGIPVLVVLSARPGFEPAWPRHPRLHELTLERLSPERTAALARESARGRALSDEVLAQVVARSDGVPLFVEELTRTVLERAPAEGGSAGFPSSIPTTLRGLLAARLDRLSARQRELARLAAVVGRGFPGQMLAALQSWDLASLERELAELVDADLLKLEPHGTRHRFQFRHPLLQETAYEQLPRSVRQELHQRIARGLESRCPEVAENEPEQVAHHHTEAGQVEPAILWWTRAAERASRYSAHEETIRHLSRALGLCERLRDPRERTRKEFELRCALQFPLLSARPARELEVQRNADRLSELARQAERGSPLLPLLYERRRIIHFNQVAPALLLQMADRICDVAEPLGAQEALLVGHRLAGVACTRLFRQSAALARFERAVACSDTLPLEQHRLLALRQWISPGAAAYAQLAFVLALLDEPEAARRRGAEAVALAERIGHPFSRAYAMTYAAAALQLLGDVHAVRRLADEAVQTCREHDLAAGESWGGVLQSWAVAEQGQPREGLASFQTYLARQHQTGADAAQAYFLSLGAEIHLRLGQWDRGLETVAAAEAWGEAREEHNHDAALERLRGLLLRGLGREAEAEGSFRRALEISLQQEQRLLWLQTASALGLLLRDAGREAERRRLRDEAASRFGARDTPALRLALKSLGDDAAR